MRGFFASRFSFSIKKFQYRVLKSVTDKKPVKKKSLFQYLNKKCKYSIDQIEDFFEDIEIDIYYPLVM